MRLIDADALYQKAMDIIHDEKDMKYLGIVNAISIAHTIDAEPVKHGKWINIRKYLMNCSVCNIDFNSDIPAMYHADSWNFCPNCGAKMDLEKSYFI